MIRRTPAFLLLAVSLLTASAPLLAQRAQRVSFRASDGVFIAASFFEAVRRPSPAVVLVPMLTRTRRDWEPFAARLASEGIAALALDLRGHGESGVTPSVEAAIPSMPRDVVAAYRYLENRPDVLGGRIGLAGASLGANVAVVAAAELPAARSLALLSPTLDYRGLRIEPVAARLTVPMLLVASREDAYALRTIRALTAGERPQREQAVLEHAGHGTVMLRRDPSLIRTLLDWFHRTL